MNPPEPATDPAPVAAAGAPAPAPTPFVSMRELALLFGRIGLTSFGGGLSAWLYREVVHQRHWIEEEDFMGALTMAQVLPGANIINLAVYVGHRLRGTLGALLAVFMLLGPPMVVVIGILTVFQSMSHVAWLHDFLEGIAATAAGLTASVGIKSARRAYAQAKWTLGLVIAMFIAVGMMRWPLLPSVTILAVTSLVLVRVAARAKP